MAGDLKTRGWLGAGIPFLEIQGAAAGPVLAVCAGIHGDEYEGVRAVYELFDEMGADLLRGALRMVPVANPRAHRAVTRCHPEDGMNLARVFPGRAGGGASEQIAHLLTNKFISQCDFFVDLHSGGVRYAMPPMAGYWLSDARGRVAAERFGAPVIWGHPEIEPGRTISVAKELGIPFLYVEAWGAGRIRASDLRMMKQGIRNLLVHLGICDSGDAPAGTPMRLTGAGNTDSGIAAGSGGFLLLEVALLDAVRAGQRLGRLVDAQGAVIESYEAPRDGVVALTHELPVVEKGDTLFLLAELES